MAIIFYLINTIVPPLMEGTMLPGININTDILVGTIALIFTAIFLIRALADGLILSDILTDIFVRRLGIKEDEKWQHVIDNLSALPVQNGVYTAIEPEPYTNRTDHPSMLAALGLLPKTPLIDVDTMRKTTQDVYKTWQWPDTWGWDYPMLAMTAARLNLPEKAVDPDLEARTGHGDRTRRQSCATGLARSLLSPWLGELHERTIRGPGSDPRAGFGRRCEPWPNLSSALRRL